MDPQLKYEVHDNVVPIVLRKELWYYLQTQKCFAMLKDEKDVNDRKIIPYYPIENKKEYYDRRNVSWNSQFMHRAVFGNNENDISKHPAIEKLWNIINQHFDNKFVINGDPEECCCDEGNDVPQRVYVNIQPVEEIKRSHAVHRDTIELDETKNFTLLYIANTEWYPTWFGELMFYENSDKFKDFQQWQAGHGQTRNFGVGHPFATIPTVPGRIVLWDGRMLHTTRPVAQWSPQFRYSLIFRVRLKD